MAMHCPSSQPESSLWAARQRIAQVLAAPESPVASAGGGAGVLRIEVALKSPAEPMQWLSHQAVYPRLYFADRDKDVVVAGVGAAETVHGANGADPAVWQRLSTALGSTERARFYGGARFDSHADPAQSGPEWAAFGGCIFVLPLWELQLSRAGCHLACHLRWGAPADGAFGAPAGHSFRQAADEALLMMERLTWLVEPVPRPVQALPLCLGQHTAVSKPEWAEAVQRVLTGCESGAWSKVVLAQRVRLQLSQPIEALHLLRCLLDADPIRVAPGGGTKGANSARPAARTMQAAEGPAAASDQAPPPAAGTNVPAAPTRRSGSPPTASPPRHAYLFLLQPHPDTAFLGCSPEQLFRLNGARLTTDALAGTRPRGATEEEDAVLAAELFASDKDLREVYAVRDFLNRVLERDCDSVAHSPPYVLQLRHVQHIAMQFTATLAGMDGAKTRGAPLLAAAARVMRLLHPTPAVCGVPTTAAHAAIRRAEPFDRGLYAGPFGYVSAGSCEFCVAIRSALLDGSQANLYGGAGILRGSNADTEWDETYFKMRPFSSLFPAAPSYVGRVLLRHQWLRHLFVEEVLLFCSAAWQTVFRSGGQPPPGRTLSPLRALAFATKISRPYFWLVTLWLYLLPTAQRYSIWSTGLFWVGLVYCTFPLNLLCYLMNDLADVEVDVGNPRKGGVLYGVVAHSAALRTAVPWAVLVQLPFLAAFAASWGAAKTLFWFLAVVGVNWVYNFGPRLSSRYAPLDLFCPCGYMLVIPLSCALNNLPPPSVQAWAHTLFFVVRSQVRCDDVTHSPQQARFCLLPFALPRSIFSVVLEASSPHRCKPGLTRSSSWCGRRCVAITKAHIPYPLPPPAWYTM
jgi:isochorismate synthase EntC